ncbi:MAG: methyltransferase domain-containing protein [Burkholderiales bacterium]|nr:methyltransferase domain-containing protein [Burkholderiales bacterium]PZN03653.1 MAG: SAM-dependent methyltransferase [Pseudomonadota bacterium]
MLRLLVALYAGLSFAVAAQAQGGEYEPREGQEGKDVIWVGTPDALIERMLDMAEVKPGDYVMDLGSGDGRIPIAAAKRGARAIGIEYNPDLVELSKRKAEAAGVADRTEFLKADLFETDLSKADVITMYLLPELNMKLRPKLLELKPGTRIVSHFFDMEDWKSDNDTVVDGRPAYLWIVPAKVGGKWKLSYPDGKETAELTLTQNFQLIWGDLRQGGETLELGAPWLAGDRIRFTVRDAQDRPHQYTGKVFDGRRMEGTVSVDGKQTRKWVATRVQ